MHSPGFLTSSSRQHGGERSPRNQHRPRRSSPLLARKYAFPGFVCPASSRNRRNPTPSELASPFRCGPRCPFSFVVREPSKRTRLFAALFLALSLSLFLCPFLSFLFPSFLTFLFSRFFLFIPFSPSYNDYPIIRGGRTLSMLSRCFYSPPLPFTFFFFLFLAPLLNTCSKLKIQQCPVEFCISH